MFRNESLKAEIEIEMDRKDLGHIIHLLVSAGKFFLCQMPVRCCAIKVLN